MNSIYQLSIAALALGSAFAGGCNTDRVRHVGEGPREAITYAARARYPGNATQADNVNAIAMTDTSRGRITVYNLGNNAIPTSAMWVNGLFVSQIPAIAPRGNTLVTFPQLLEAGPGVRSLDQAEQPPRKVELQTSEGLYSVQGPIEQ